MNEYDNGVTRKAEKVSRGKSLQSSNNENRRIIK